MDMEAKLSNILLNITAPFIPAIGKIQIPLPRLMGKLDADSFMATDPLPGISLLSRKRLQLTNKIIPGWWKHMCKYVGVIGDTPMIVEAIWPFVRMVPVDRWFKGEDYAIARKPTYMTESQMVRSAGKMLHLLGLPYDVRVNLTVNLDEFDGHPAFYCAETNWWSDNEVLKEDGLVNPFEPRLTAGIWTISPSDAAQADGKWTDWWKSSTLKAYESEKAA